MIADRHRRRADRALRHQLTREDVERVAAALADAEAAVLAPVLALADRWQASGEQHDRLAEEARARFDLSAELAHGLTAADLIEHADALRRAAGGGR